MSEPVAIRVNPANFGVPLPSVSVQFDEAIRLWHRHRDNRYFAGVFEAFRWLAALTNVRPVSGDQIVASPATILDELVRAGSLAGGVPCPGAPSGVHPEWARGVERTLQWATGRSAAGRAPLPWPAGTVPHRVS